MQALERGWIPKGNLKADVIVNACHKEDNGLYLCIAKRDQLETNIQDGINYALTSEGTVTSSDGKTSSSIVCDRGIFVNETIVLNFTTVASMSGDELYAAADCAYNLYWSNHRGEGVTCDFGGTATLVQVNITYADDDDDTTDETVVVDVAAAELAGLIGLGALLGAFMGFAIAMRCSKKFNTSVSKSTLGRSMKRNPILSKSFGGFRSDEYVEIPSAHF